MIDKCLLALALTLAFTGGALISYALFGPDVVAGPTTPPVQFHGR